MRDDVLAVLAGVPLVGAFVYGSVARGTSTVNSDIDVFVVLEAGLPQARIVALHTAFVDLQHQLGYQPDLEYPVELFTYAEVLTALTVDEPDEDQQEIRRALRDTKTALIESTRMDELIAAAGALP